LFAFILTKHGNNDGRGRYVDVTQKRTVHINNRKTAYIKYT